MSSHASRMSSHAMREPLLCIPNDLACHAFAAPPNAITSQPFHTGRPMHTRAPPTGAGVSATRPARCLHRMSSHVARMSSHVAVAQRCHHAHGVASRPTCSPSHVLRTRLHAARGTPPRVPSHVVACHTHVIVCHAHARPVPATWHRMSCPRSIVTRSHGILAPATSSRHRAAWCRMSSHVSRM